jgi:hypothetical protein
VSDENTAGCVTRTMRRGTASGIRKSGNAGAKRPLFESTSFLVMGFFADLLDKSGFPQTRSPQGKPPSPKPGQHAAQAAKGKAEDEESGEEIEEGHSNEVN